MERSGLKTVSMKYILGKTNLKKDLLYFDKLVIDKNDIKFAITLGKTTGKIIYGETETKNIITRQQAQLDFLETENLIEKYDSNEIEKDLKKHGSDDLIKLLNKKGTGLFSMSDVLSLGSAMVEGVELSLNKINPDNSAFKNLFFSEIINKYYNLNVIPIFKNFVADKNFEFDKEQKILEIVLKKFPIIDDSVSWEQLIDYKNDPESNRKFLALRNWMIEISKGEYTPNEVSEKFDFLYSEYGSHIKRHKLKTQIGTFKGISITTAEILGDLASFKWGKVIKTGFEILEKNTRLVEIESGAPGREIGYLYDIDQRFKK